MDENLINSIYEAKQRKEEIDKQIIDLKAEEAELDNYIEEISNRLLIQMKSNQTKILEKDNLIADIFSRETVGYTSDKEVIDYLKANGYDKYVKTKITESLDKTPLKKALKADETLAQAIKDMIIKTTTEYVVVTTKENHEKMLEHMSGGKE